MVFKKLHLGTAAYSNDTFDDIQRYLSVYYLNQKSEKQKLSGTSVKRNAISRNSVEGVKALALCHNVVSLNFVF